MKAGRISFRALREADLPLMHRWLNTPHVSEWWSLDGNHHPSLEEVEAKYSPRVLGRENVDCYIFSCDDKPTGMIQACDMDKELKEKADFGLQDNCVGIDLFIGEENSIHRGLGSRIVRQFLKQIVFADKKAAACSVDPYAENKIAIKCYQKAGFHYLRTAWYEADRREEDVYIVYRDEIR